MKRKGLIAGSAVIAALSLMVSACGSTENKDDEQPQAQKTTLTVGWNQPYWSYNGQTSNGNATANNNIAYLMNGNFWYYDPESNLQTDETFGTYEKLSDDPLTVKYTVSDDNKWSDGTPVDAADLLLQWAAQSSVLNTIAADKVRRDEATGLPLNTEGQVFFDSSGPGLSLVTETPEISDDGKSLTLKYDKSFADWQLDMLVTVPAHVTAMHALNLDDPQEAKDALIKAIQDKDKAALTAISLFWNTGYDFTSLPEDKSLYLSNGAYLMTKFVENEYMTLEKNPDYHGLMEPKIDELTVRWNEDPLAQVQALQNGELSMISPQVTEDVVKEAKKIEGVEVMSQVESTYEHIDLVLNNKGPFDPDTYGGDAEKAKLIRQAFLHAYPRQEIVDKLIVPIQADAAVRNSFLLAPGFPGYDEMVAANGSDAYSETDPAKAKQLLNQAGVNTPIDVRVMYAKDNARREAQFEIVKPALAKAGFNLINARNADWGSKLGDGTYDAVFFGWQSTSTGVSADQATFATGMINNLIGYSNKQVDDLFNELVVTDDEAKQLELQTEIEKHLFADAIGLTIFQFPMATIIKSSDVTGVDPALLAPTMFYGFWNWEIPS